MQASDEQAARDLVEAIAKELGRALQAWMTTRGLGVEDLAERLGYHRTTITHAISGRDVPATAFFERCERHFGGAAQLLQLREKLEQAREDRRQAARARRQARRGSEPHQGRSASSAAAATPRPLTTDAFLAWIADHSTLSFEETYRAVSARVEQLERQDPSARSARAYAHSRITREQVANALASYYGTAGPAEGGARFYRASVGGAMLTTSILTRPDWLGTAVRLGTEDERCDLAAAPEPASLQLEGEALEAALGRLATVESYGTVFYDNALYRLLDVSITREALTAVFSLMDFAGYALTIDLLEGELLDALASRPGPGTSSRLAAGGLDLPLRRRYLPTIHDALQLEARVCSGGALALLAAARPSTDRRRFRDFALLVQERSPRVLNATGKLAVVPKAFHQPFVEPMEEAAISATLERELEEELLGRLELGEAGRKADPFHLSALTEPMRWLAERRGTDSYRIECVGFGLNMVSGNFEFPCLIVIDDEEWWSRFGSQIEANWEIHRIRRCSSLDAGGLQALILDPRWSNEGLFAFLEGLRRLAEVDTIGRVALPHIEREP